MPEKEIRIETTIPLKEYKKIEKLVKEERYKSPSDFFKKAVLQLIEEEISKVELDRKTILAIKRVLRDKKQKKSDCPVCGNNKFRPLPIRGVPLEFCEKCGTVRAGFKKIKG